MKLRIEFPAISPAIQGGVIVKWHKSVGETVTYGDDLVDVAIQEVTRMRRRLGSSIEKPGKTKYRKLTDISVRYRLSSMDSGTLGDISAPEGTRIRVGDVVGHLSAAGDTTLDTAPAARVTANVLEVGEPQ